MMTRTKWLLVVAFWIAQGLTAYLACAFLWVSSGGVTPKDQVPVVEWSDLLRTLRDPEYVIWCAAFALAVPILQVVFVLPVRSPRAPKDPDHGFAPAWLSAIVGGFIVAGMALAAFLAAHEVLDEFVVSLPGFSVPVSLVFLGVSWVAGTLLIASFCRGPSREDVLSRTAARLFLGTIVEVAAIIPLDALVRKRETCHCWAGTYFALLICGAVGAVAFGPAVFLPLLAKRRKRLYNNRCQVCGYDMSGSRTHPRCPECGSGWREPSPPAADVPPDT